MTPDFFVDLRFFVNFVLKRSVPCFSELRPCFSESFSVFPGWTFFFFFVIYLTFSTFLA